MVSVAIINEHIRDQIRLATCIPMRLVGGTDTQAAADCTRLKKRPKKVIKLSGTKNGEEVTTTKELETDSYHSTETRAKGSSKSPISENYGRLIPVVTAINEQTPTVSNWINYVYNDSQDWVDISATCLVVLNEIIKGFKRKPARTTLKQIDSLVLLAAMDVKHEINHGSPLKRPTEVKKLLNKGDKAWEKTWAPRWAKIRKLFFKLDTQALGLVDIATKHQRQDRKERRDHEAKRD